jgi:O-antigen biosynthesis protein
VLPSFSIVLPVYKSPVLHLLCQLEAIRAQTWPLFECVIVDDGTPTTDVFTVIGRWVSTDSRFVVRRLPQNGGIAVATNAAIELSRNEFVVFCDHDDLLEPHALAALAEAFTRHPDVDIVYSDEALVDEAGALLGFFKKPDYSPQRLLGQNYFNHVTSIRRDLLRRIPLRTAYEPAQDFDLLLRVVPRARRISHIRRVLYRWRAIPGSVALSLDAKSGVAEAVRSCSEGAVRAAGYQARVTSVEGHASSAWVHFEAPRGVSVEEMDVAGRTAAHIDAGIRRSSADFVVLGHGAARPQSPSDGAYGWCTPLIAQASQPNVGWVGARLVTEDGRLVSAGRVHGAAPCDQFAGIEATNAGPWGAFLVAREVASVAPAGAAILRERYIAAGGFDAELPLEVAMAVHCTQLRLLGCPSINTPLCELPFPEGTQGWTPTREERVAYNSCAQRLPPLLDDPYDSLGASGVPAGE